MKFGTEAERPEAYAYQHVYELQRLSHGEERLLIGPRRGHIELMIELIEFLHEPLRLLYILVVPRNGQNKPGRYEADSELSYDDAERLLKQFSDFFESDGRHHLWIASPDHGTVVYDRHELLYAYGPLDRFIDVLNANGLKEGKVTIPGPHWHAYHPEFDDAESELLSRFEWFHSSLREGDDL